MSRGITLESLAVSYYSRPARNSDTLLQMGRWFGYRPGYLDLCRLFTTEDIVGCYQQTTIMDEEFRDLINEMNAANLTPEDFGLRIRTHPNGLNITAINKMRNSQIFQVTFSDNLCQTTVFHKDRSKQEKNFEKTVTWISNLGTSSGKKKNNVIWQKNSSEDILNFLKDFIVHPLSRKADPDLIAEYIKKMNEQYELTKWTIALISNHSAKRFVNIGDHEIGLTSRTARNVNSRGDIYWLPKSNLISPMDQGIDLSEAQMNEAQKLANRQKPVGPSIRRVRKPQSGLLLLYPLNPDQVLLRDSTFTNKPIIGYAVSFPRSRNPEVTVEYKGNSTYWNARYGEENDDF